MQKDLREKLAEFGFTVNQAKVYLSIIQSGKTNIGQISKNTFLHRQDIYKLLPKLEKRGLITRTIDKPLMVEALPIKQALERLIAKEKETSDQKIVSLEKTLKQLIQEVKQQPKTAEDTRFTYLTANVALKNRLNFTFKTKPSAFKVVCTLENLKGQTGQFFKQYFQLLADNMIQTHLMIVGAQNTVDLKRSVEKLAPRGAVFVVKALERCASKDYQVVDSGEVWIATQQKTTEGYPSILWTNDENMVKTYLENFNEAWNNPNAVPVYGEAGIKLETLKVPST
jgi:sugar-specific transcriptional regulator TrmB